MLWSFFIVSVRPGDIARWASLSDTGLNFATSSAFSSRYASSNDAWLDLDSRPLSWSAKCSTSLSVSVPTIPLVQTSGGFAGSNCQRSSLTGWTSMDGSSVTRQG